MNVNYHFHGVVPGVAPFGVGAGVGVNGSYSVGSTDSNPTNPFGVSASTTATIP